jgi:mono/diheme cytochrome c family protein
MRGLVLLWLAACTTNAAAADPASRARSNFQLHCMGCHAEDGAGLKGKVPSLRESLPRFLASPDGREFIVRVPGVSQASLPSDELAAVLNWVAREFGGASALKPETLFTVAEVQRLRMQPLLDVSAARARLWSMVPTDPR